MSYVLQCVSVLFFHSLISCFVQIVDPESGKELGVDEDGEICGKGPSVSVMFFLTSNRIRCIKVYTYYARS